VFLLHFILLYGRGLYHMLDNGIDGYGMAIISHKIENTLLVG